MKLSRSIATITRSLVYETFELRNCPSAVAFAERRIDDAVHNEEAPISVQAVDIDGDDDLDVIAAFGGPLQGILMYENRDGIGDFGPDYARRINTIISDAVGVSLVAADFDTDGDADIALVSQFSFELRWFENVDGNGSFGPERQIAAGDGSLASSLDASDVDQDGDVDLLMAVRGPSAPRVVWYENLDGSGTFAAEKVIDDTAMEPSSIQAVDVDGDSDMDVILASFQDNTVAWFENDGRGQFGDLISDPIIISSAVAGVHYTRASDVDNDGDADVLTASARTGTLAWFENLDGAGTFGPENPFGQLPAANWVFGADVDGDGDQDVLAASRFYAEWFENTNGRGEFAFRSSVHNDDFFFEAIRPTAADVDNDGDADFVIGNIEGAAWYESMIPGDANDNGRFDSSDLVTVFQAGEYEDQVPFNSTFEEGDWDGDYDFTTADLVFALAAGRYPADQTASVRVDIVGGMAAANILLKSPLAQVLKATQRTMPSDEACRSKPTALRRIATDLIDCLFIHDSTESIDRLFAGTGGWAERYDFDLDFQGVSLNAEGQSDD
jgi:hypothetical protein